MCLFNFCCCRESPKICNLVEPTQPNNAASRLLTFTDYPDGAQADPFELAEAGFYYTGDADSVKCAFCKVIVRQWTQADVPIMSHWQANPRCKFIKGWNVNNVPLIEDPVRGRNSFLNNLDVICGPLRELAI